MQSFVKDTIETATFGFYLCISIKLGEFNHKSSLYIYINYIRFGWVGFYGISNIVGYLMTNLVYTYILNIYELGFMTYQPL